MVFFSPLKEVFNWILNFCKWFGTFYNLQHQWGVKRFNMLQLKHPFFLPSTQFNTYRQCGAQSNLTGVNDEENRAQRDCYCILLHDFYFILLFFKRYKEKWSLCFWWCCLPTLNSWHCYAIHKASMCKASLPLDAHALQQWGAQHTPESLIIQLSVLFPPLCFLVTEVGKSIVEALKKENKTL